MAQPLQLASSSSSLSSSSPAAAARKRLLLEVCVDTPAGLQAALDNGADRIELCGALALGGLTPSLGLIEMAAGASREKQIPIVAMIRPRAGNFVYSRQEVEVMKKEIAYVKAQGLAGVVVGATKDTDMRKEDGKEAMTVLDLEVLRELIQAAKGETDIIHTYQPSFTVTLHRAIDLTADPEKSIRQILEELPAGSIDRVLTSGGEASAWDGKETIQKLVKTIAKQEERDKGGARSSSSPSSYLSVMAGAGVNVDNVEALVKATHVTELHASCSSSSNEYSMSSQATKNKALRFGFISEASERDTDPAKVKALAAHVKAINQANK